MADGRRLASRRPSRQFTPQRIFEGLEPLNCRRTRFWMTPSRASGALLAPGPAGTRCTASAHTEISSVSQSTALSQGTEPAEIEIVDATLYEQVDATTGVVPALVRASVTPPQFDADTWLAVAVNGTIAATTRQSLTGLHRGAQFTVIVPPTSFVTGNNEIDLLPHRRHTSGTCTSSPRGRVIRTRFGDSFWESLRDLSETA